MSDFSSRKIVRKVKKLTSMLYNDTKIECCEEPTKYLFIGNAGLTTGLQRESLLTYCTKYGVVEDIVMIPGKSYCFVTFQDVCTCATVFDNLQATQMIPDYKTTLYLAFSKSVPEVQKNDWRSGPADSVVLENFITTEEEIKLMQCIDWETPSSGQSLKHRKVIHFGYEFQYHNNNINKDAPLEKKIPSECEILFHRLKEMGYISHNPDQLTVNQYLPGQGIPPHIDTHSACEDTILSLSLGSSVVMDFKHRDGRTMPLLLPERSMLIMSGEARYAWSHGITPRKTDIVPSLEGGLSVQTRGIRTSFTFRWLRREKCRCNYYLECDSYTKANDPVEQSDENAARLEEMHVQKVYEDIADHFSETRHKPWPNVLGFVQSLSKGDILVDVGCGNGKYFGYNKGIFEIGCDSSWNLSLVCNERGFQVFTCNCLEIPLKDNVANACISIAVIHHLANQNRRVRALQEIVRVLKPSGKALIYVWAKNQEHNAKKSSYLKQNRQKQKYKRNEGESEHMLNLTPKCHIADSENCMYKETVQHVDNSSQVSEAPAFSLPLHTNRTQFLHKDVLVPWKLKPQLQNIQETEVRTFYRYYHVFEKEELEEMCLMLKNVDIVKCFYDQGNWCVIIEKKY